MPPAPALASSCPRTTAAEPAAHDHYPVVYRFALTLVRDASRAADLTQQTFLIWARKGHQLRDPAKTCGWLCATLRREHLRACRRQARSPLVEFDEDTHHEITAGSAGATAPFADRLDAAVVMSAVRALREEHRAPLLLFYEQDLSYAQIAATLHLSLGTVMSRLSRAKAAVRLRLRLRLDPPSPGTP